MSRIALTGARGVAQDVEVGALVHVAALCRERCTPAAQQLRGLEPLAVLLNLADSTPVLQNEEHFAIDTPSASKWKIGDVVYAVPTHVCPTVALHRRACVVENNRFIGTWEIASRDRKLTV